MLYLTTDYQSTSEQLQLAAEKILSTIFDLQYKNEDARNVGLTNMRIAILRAGYQVNLLKNLKKGTLPWPQLAPYMGIDVNASFLESNFSIIGDIFDVCERMSLQTIYQFQLENMLANIQMALGLPTKSKYSQIISSLLTALQIVEPDKKIDALTVLALIRNTLHSNGVHKMPDRTITLGNVMYEFKKDTAIRCATWDYLVYALHYSINATIEIITHPKVRSLPEPLFDNFAWDIETL